MNFFKDMAIVADRESGGRCWFYLVLPADVDLVEGGLLDEYPNEKFRGRGTWPELTDILVKWPHTSVLLEPAKGSWNRQERYVDERIIERFSRMYGTGVIDAVVTHRARVGAQLAGLADDRRAEKGEVPVMYWETNSSLYPRYRTQEALQAMHYALVNSMFLTGLEREIAAALCRRYLSPAQVDAFYRRSMVIAQPANTDFLDGVIAEADADRAANPPNTKTDQFVLFFGSRFSEVKRIPQVLESFDSVFSSGHNVRVVMTTPTSEWMTGDFLDPQRYPYVELTADCGRDEFFAKAARGHAFVSHGLDGHECHGISFIQKLYLGLAASFPKHEKWPREVLPEWYPYWHASQAEAHMWLAVFERRWRETGSCWQPGELDRLREFIRNRVGDTKVIEPVWAMMAKQRAERGYALAGLDMVREGIERIRDQFEAGTPVTLLDLEKSMAKISTGGFKPVAGSQRRQGFPTSYEVLRIATGNLGLEDRYDDATIRLTLPGVALVEPVAEPLAVQVAVAS